MYIGSVVCSHNMQFMYFLLLLPFVVCSQIVGDSDCVLEEDLPLFPVDAAELYAALEPRVKIASEIDSLAHRASRVRGYNRSMNCLAS